MAVARCELGVREIDWVVAMCEQATHGRSAMPAPKLDAKEEMRVMRELKRAQRAAHEAKAREEAHTRRIKAAFRTAPGKDTEVLDHGQMRR